MSLQPIKKPAVLLAESDPDSASQLMGLLESWNYAVELVGTGSEALLRLSETGAPSIAILNYDLPGLSGIEAVQEFRRRQRKNSVWIIVLSDQASPETVLLANDAGVDDFIVKPLLEMDLRIRLKTAERVQLLHAELNHSVEAMRFRSSHDSLTGVWNRESMISLLFQETDRVQRMQTPLCLLLLDADNFSRVNAEHGPQGGDEVLRQIVERFRRYLRSYDLIGRHGGDEFLVALPGCSDGHSETTANRLLRCVFHRPFDSGGEKILVTASFGLAQSKGRSPLIVLREAEYALRQAKQAGGNCVIHFGKPPNFLRTPGSTTRSSATDDAPQSVGAPSPPASL
jgi:two-component system, cell cycle response regulator